MENERGRLIQMANNSVDRPRPNKRGAQQREAYKRLREMIIRQKLGPGNKVSELELSRLMGLGRSPVRVALRALLADGLISIVPQTGVMILGIDYATELKVLEVRTELERLVTARAVRCANATQRAQMHELAIKLDAIAQDDGLRLGLLLRDIHDVVTDTADNEFLTGVMERIHALSRRFWYAHYKKFDDIPHAASLHATRLRYIAEGNPEQALAASDAIMAYVESYVRRIVADEQRQANESNASTRIPKRREKTTVRPT
jgi:DNA-binding GntR family transcriptional regulator